jgi:hypothetical protein
MSDWHDPFAKTEEELERERRRAEREERRRQRQGSIGDKVQAEQAKAAEAEPEPVTAAARRQAGLEPEAPPTAAPEAAAPPVATPPATQPPPAATTPPPRRPSGRTPHEELLIRRVVGAVIAIAVLALLIFGATKIIGSIGGDGSDEGSGPTPTATNTSNFTIAEGLDRHQIADLAEKAKLKGDYEEASKSFKGFDPSKYGADDPPNLEGFLFPATYELPDKPTVKDLISRQLDAFEQNISSVDMSYAKSKNLNVYDVLKIASMIEREVQVPKERPLVAEVIYNRLHDGSPLGIDATIRYYLQNYDEQLTESELADESDPYNTRIIPGLPPTPIGNPGLDSIKAAANPAKGDLFYFVVKPGTCGEHFFTASQQEFEQAEADYQQALQEQGGSPTDC